MTYALRRSEQSRGAEGVSIAVEVRRAASGDLALRFVLAGGRDVRFAPAAAAERTDELWRSTCFEVFVETPGDGYLELNFAPSTRWAAYRFSGYRSGMAPVELPAPRIEVEQGAERFELRAEVAGLPGEGPWRVGLSAVVEDLEGRVSYWALAHPGEKPDFHHPDSFVLELAPP